MSSRSIAEAGERLPEPVELALRGGPVAIACGRRPAKPQPIDSVSLLRQMRDEGP